MVTMSQAQSFSFEGRLSAELQKEFTRLNPAAKRAHSEQADGYASVIMRNVDREFKQMDSLNPKIPAMDELPIAILMAKLNERGCQVEQRLGPPSNGGWFIKLVG